MVKIVLVDDEERIRQGLAKLIERVGSEYKVTGTYAAGNELLADIQQQRVEADLVITDIKMPGLSGLEMLEKLRAVRPDWKFIVLSGFNSFVYAQQALRLGVEDYLLKPVDVEELSQLLRKVRSGLERERARTSGRTTDQIRMLLFGEPDAMPPHLREEACAELRNHPLFADHFAVFVLYSHSGAALAHIESASRGWQRDGLAVSKDDSVAAVVVPIREGDHADTVNELGQTLQRLLPVRCNGRIGAGDVFRGPEWLREAYLQATAAMQHAWYSPGASGFANYAKLPRRTDGSAYGHPIALLARDFRELLALHDFDRAGEAIREWLISLMQRKPTWNELKNGCETVAAMILGEQAAESSRHHPVFNSDVLDPAGSPNSEVYAERFLSAAAAAFRLLQEDKQEKRVVEEIKSYIQRHYTEELELSRLAEVVYLTPSYLSKLFKSETGGTITEYLIAVRMERAKALLRDNRAWKTYEVGEQVGYADPAYFNKVFKRFVGCTPKEFRERVR